MNEKIKIQLITEAFLLKKGNDTLKVIFICIAFLLICSVLLLPTFDLEKIGIETLITADIIVMLLLAFDYKVLNCRINNGL